MREFPKLSWLNGKDFKSSLNSQKNRPGLKAEQAMALLEDAGLHSAIEVDKVLASSPVLPPIPEVMKIKEITA